MATTVAALERLSPPRRAIDLRPTAYDRCLAVVSAILLLFVLIALLRGRSEWTQVPLMVWAHIGTVSAALALTPVIMLRRRGDDVHRLLGRIWAAALAGTAAFSFGIRGINGDFLSPIHILSAWTLIQVPWIVWTARTHRIAQHRRAVRGMVTGALIIAGLFTFPFGRLLGSWLFG